MQKLIFTFIIFCSSFSFTQANNFIDSIGVFTIKGNDYVLYEVDKGETLYSIGKKYNINVDEIISANSYIKDYKISHGQIIKIPLSLFYGSQSGTSVAAGEAITSDETGDVPVNDDLIKHTVQKGETLYSLSKKYGIRVTKIVEWNNLKNYAINEGQILVVGKDSAPTETASNSADSVQDAVMEDNNAPVPPSTSSTKENLKAENILSLQYKEQLSANGYQEEHRTGIATWINSSSPYPTDDGYYALHKNLPIGTIVKVKNLMNNRVIYAKVIGNLPDNSENDKLLIKLPQEAAKELNVLDAKMMVQVSHLEHK